MTRGSSSSLGPSMMACFCLGICLSSKASITGRRLSQEPTASCTGVTGTLHIAPHAPLLHLMLRRLPGGPHCNTGMLHHQEPCHCLDHPGPSALRSTVNMLPRAASSYSAERATAASLDHCCDEEEDGPFHQFHAHRVQLGCPRKEAEVPPCQVVHSSPAKSGQIDPLWRTTK